MQPHYLVCNADESEPGTFSNRVLMEGDPFAVVESMAIAAFATGASRAFRWTAATGVQNLSSIYAGSIGSGSYLPYATAISGDGRHVVGYGYNRRSGRYEAYSTN